MNIKEHIEAGHYPKDEKGRALVPTDHPSTLVVWAADCPKVDLAAGSVPLPIAGWDVERKAAYAYSATGAAAGVAANHLLPPQPRKVEVKRWEIVYRDGGSHYAIRTFIVTVLVLLLFFGALAI